MPYKKMLVLLGICSHHASRPHTHISATARQAQLQTRWFCHIKGVSFAKGDIGLAGVYPRNPKGNLGANPEGPGSKQVEGAVHKAIRESKLTCGHPVPWQGSYAIIHILLGRMVHAAWLADKSPGWRSTRRESATRRSGKEAREHKGWVSFY